MRMSLILRRLPAWSGKLFSALIGVNVACTSTSGHVPGDVAAEAREYLLTSSRAPSAREIIATEPRLVWRANVGRGVKGLPAVTSRVTLVTTTDRWVYALDTRTGDMFWRRRGDGTYSIGPVVGGGRVFVASEGTGGRVTALRLADGRRMWQTSVGDVSAPLALRDSVLYGVTDDGTAFAIARTDGRVLWRRTAGPSRSGPAVTDRFVAIPTLRDTLIVLDRNGGSVVSASPLPSATAAPAALMDDTTLVLTSPAGAIHMIQIPSGGVRWSVETGEPMPGGAVAHADTVFALGGSCTLFRVHRHAPTSLERTMVPGCITTAGPLVTRDGVLVATLSGVLMHISRATGARTWIQRIGSALRHPPVVVDRQIILATLGGEVFAFR